MKKRGPWLWLIPLLVVVVVAVTVPFLLAGGGSQAARSPQGGGSPALKPLRSWQATYQAMTTYNQGLGVRSYGNDMLTVADTAVTAFARDTGKQDWVLTPPGANTEFCALSRNMGNGRLALGFGPVTSGQVSCISIGIVNLATHSFVWSKQVFDNSVGNSAELPSGMALVFAGNYLYLGAKTVIARISVSNGAAQSLGPGFENDQNPCYVDDMAADSSTVYVLGGCIGSTTYEALIELNAGSGSLRATSTINASEAKAPDDGNGINGGQFVSVSPLVLMLSTVKGNSSYGTFVRLGSGLRVSWSKAQQEGASGAIDTMLDSVSIADAVHQYNRAFVWNGLLFGVTTFQNRNGVPNSNKVVALDVNSGQQRWATTVPGDSMCDPVGMDGSTLLVAGDQLWTGVVNDPATVLAKFDASSGRLLSTKTQSNPIEGARSGVTLSAFEAMNDIAWIVADGRVYGYEQGDGQTGGSVAAFSLG